MLSSTPAAKYDQRQNRGGVVCTLNDAPRSWCGRGSNVTIDHYDLETALKAPYQYMFQKVSEKALGKYCVMLKVFANFAERSTYCKAEIYAGANFHKNTTRGSRSNNYNNSYFRSKRMCKAVGNNCAVKTFTVFILR